MRRPLEEGVMLFKKLFQLLVVGSAVAGASVLSGCATANTASAAKPDAPSSTPPTGGGGGVMGW
jgi:hypothetical protein